ncbi:hypothetical protein ACI65C_004573 [Semiaphis heraclei]
MPEGVQLVGFVDDLAILAAAQTSDALAGVDARNLFNGLEPLYVYFSRSSTNFKLCEMQKELVLIKITLSQLSDNRWVCGLKSCDALINNYDILTNGIDEEESKDVAQAIALGSSACLINGVKETLKKIRTPEYLAELWEEIINFAENNDISINIPIGFKRHRTETKNLKDYHVTVTTATENSLYEDDSLKKKYWEDHANYPILDAIICPAATLAALVVARSYPDGFIWWIYCALMCILSASGRLHDVMLQELAAMLRMCTQRLRNT